MVRLAAGTLSETFFPLAAFALAHRLHRRPFEKGPSLRTVWPRRKKVRTMLNPSYLPVRPSTVFRRSSFPIASRRLVLVLVLGRVASRRSTLVVDRWSSSLAVFLSLHSRFDAYRFLSTSASIHRARLSLYIGRGNEPRFHGCRAFKLSNFFFASNLPRIRTSGFRRCLRDSFSLEEMLS